MCGIAAFSAFPSKHAVSNTTVVDPMPVDPMPVDVDSRKVCVYFDAVAMRWHYKTRGQARELAARILAACDELDRMVHDDAVVVP